MNLRQTKLDYFENSRMSFGEHLEELRKVLIKSLLSIAVGCVFGFLLANSVINMLTGPLVRAMTKYAQINAADELTERQGFVDPDLKPWLEQDKLIPRQSYVDPASLVQALQTVMPDFAPQVTVDPYRFEAGQFPTQHLPELCRCLTDNPPAQDQAVSSPELLAQRKKIWSLLNAAEQSAVTRISQLNEQASQEDAETIAQLFSRLTRETKLFEQAEFASDLAEANAGWLASMFSTPQTNPLARMKGKYDAAPSDHLGRQLNRALLSKLFAPQLAEKRRNLVPIEVWEPADFQPQSLGVSESFMVWMKTGLLTGITFAAPVVFYHLWTFVAAGLYPHEQKYVYLYLPISIALFLAGVLLAFFFVFEPVLDFLFSFNRQMGIAPQMRINDWLSFVLFLPIGFGIGFQLPLVMLFLNRIGLIQVEDYISKFRVAIMIIFIVSAILTPADYVSLLFLAIPMTFLYFVGILLCKWMPKPQNPFGEENRQYTPI